MTTFDRLITLDAPQAGVIELREATIRRWPIFVWGEVHHPDGNFTVDRQFYDDLKEWIDAKRADGYRPPIWRSHAEEGISYGLVLDLVATEQGIDVVADLTEWLSEMFDKGHVPNWSPSFYTNFTDSTGRTFRRALKELSFVGVPHMKQVPQVAGQHYAMSENGMVKIGEKDMAADIIVPAPEIGDEGSEGMDMGMGERMKALEDKVSAIYDMLNARASGEQLAEDKSVEEMTENMSDKQPEEMKQLSERLARLERENATLRREKVAGEIRAQLPSASKALTESLIRLSESAPADYQTQLSEMVKIQKTATPGTQERGQMGASVQTVATQEGGSDLVQLMENAKRGGIQRGAALLSHLEGKGINPRNIDGAAWQSALSRVYGA